MLINIFNINFQNYDRLTAFRLCSSTDSKDSSSYINSQCPRATTYPVNVCMFFPLLFAAHRRHSVLMHPTPVLLHRFQFFELFVTDIALEGFRTAYAKESPHTS